MRCVACGTEMLLVKVAPDTTMMGSGYERYTLQCLGCYEIQEHLIFNRAKRSRRAEPSVTLPVLSMACIEADNELDQGEALLKRAINMVRAPTRRPSPYSSD